MNADRTIGPVYITDSVYTILMGLARGKTLKQISFDIGVTLSTVNYHLYSMREQTGLTTFQAVALVYAAETFKLFREN